MKLKKIIFVSISLIVTISIMILSLYLFSYKQNNLVCVMGNDIEIKQEYSKNNTFTFNEINSSLLVKMIKEDSSKIENGKVVRLSTLIKNSKYVVINIGIDDICLFVKEYEDKLIYDKEVIERKITILSNNIEMICENIKKVNIKVIIYLSKLNYPYKIYDKDMMMIFEKTNKMIENITYENGFNVL